MLLVSSYAMMEPLKAVAATALVTPILMAFGDLSLGYIGSAL